MQIISGNTCGQLKSTYLVVKDNDIGTVGAMLWWLDRLIEEKRERNLQS